MWPRWIRAATTLWVAWDSKKRKNIDWFWVLAILLLGPLLLPFYMTLRPLLKGERHSKCFFWNFLVNLEKIISGLVTLAIAAVFVENITLPRDSNLAEVKRAEIKAGSIMGIILSIIIFGLEKIGFGILREYIEKDS